MKTKNLNDKLPWIVTTGVIIVASIMLAFAYASYNRLDNAVHDFISNASTVQNDEDAEAVMNKFITAVSPIISTSQSQAKRGPLKEVGCLLFKLFGGCGAVNNIDFGGDISKYEDYEDCLDQTKDAGYCRDIFNSQDT